MILVSVVSLVADLNHYRKTRRLLPNVHVKIILRESEPKKPANKIIVESLTTLQTQMTLPAKTTS